MGHRQASGVSIAPPELLPTVKKMILRDDHPGTGTVALTGASAGPLLLQEWLRSRGAGGAGKACPLAWWLGLEAGGFWGQRGWDFSLLLLALGKGGAGKDDLGA